MSIISLIILVLFTIGIESISTGLWYRYNLTNNTLENRISLEPIVTIFGILFYCSLSNLILLLPALFKTFNLPNRFVYNSFLFLNNSLPCLVFFFVIVALVKIFLAISNKYLNKNNEINKGKYTLKMKFYTGLAISSLAYLFLAPKGINEALDYDTGLYHLPFINHISEFFIEPGLASLHERYGFYVLQFFGQATLQSLAPGPDFMFPSLNISFFGIFIWFLLAEFSNIKVNPENKGIKYSKYLILASGISLIFFSSNNFLVLLGNYNPHLLLSILGVIATYTLVSSSLLGIRANSIQLIYLISFLAPAVKLTGVLISVFSLTSLILFRFKSIYSKGFYFGKIKILDLFNSIRLLIPNKSSEYEIRSIINILIIVIYLIAFSTNLVTSGYFLFPDHNTGPIGQFAADKDFVISIKSSALAWARFQHNMSDFKLNPTFLEWFTQFTASLNFKYIISFWFAPTLASIFITGYKNYLFNKSSLNVEISLFEISLILLIVELTSLIFLLPEGRYYPWISSSSIYLFTISVYDLSYKIFPRIAGKLKYIFLILVVIYLSLIWPMSKTNSLFVSNINRSFLSSPIISSPRYKTIKAYSEKWIPFSNKINNSITLNVPLGSEDRCWGISPPCTPGNKSLLNEAKLIYQLKESTNLYMYDLEEVEEN